MDKAAIVTGASSGIGKAVSRMICESGYQVFGLGRDFTSGTRDANTWEENFHPIVCDLLNQQQLTETIKKIKKEREVSILVNNAGTGYYGLHEEINPKKIQEMVRINLEVPMILSQMLLRDLKKNHGFIINISSVTAEKENPHGCAYGATKAGLSSFSKSLFEENRKYGIKVVNIEPDMTKTNLYRNADFCEGEERESYLLPEDIAETVKFALEQGEGIVLTNMTVRPQFHRIRKKKLPNPHDEKNMCEWRKK